MKLRCIQSVSAFMDLISFIITCEIWFSCIGPHSVAQRSVIMASGPQREFKCERWFSFADSIC